MEKHREELRYYADLARFASKFTVLSSPLGLRLSPAVVLKDRRADVNAAAVRALLDLDNDQPAPSWASDLGAGPSRRVGASRIPQPSEIVRMLLAFAERTLVTPKLRAELDSTSGEFEERRRRRRHASATKKLFTHWEAKKKKLAEARVQCKTAAETKANKELVGGDPRL